MNKPVVQITEESYEFRVILFDSEDPNGINEATEILQVQYGGDALPKETARRIAERAAIDVRREHAGAEIMMNY